MDTSSTADWIAAIGQAIGAIGTLAAVVVALSIARRDGRRAERERREKEASQARMITTRTEQRWEEIGEDEQSAIVVRNNSSQAISSLTIKKAKVLGRNLQWFPVEDAGAGLEVLEPNTAARFTGSWRLVGESDDSNVAVNTSIRFVDSSGTWWDRVNNSEPVRSYPDPTPEG